MKIVRITAALAVVCVATSTFAQMKTKMETNKIEAKALYDAFKQGKGEQHKKRMQISGEFKSYH